MAGRPALAIRLPGLLRARVPRDRAARASLLAHVVDDVVRSRRNRYAPRASHVPNRVRALGRRREPRDRGPYRNRRLPEAQAECAPRGEDEQGYAPAVSIRAAPIARILFGQEPAARVHSEAGRGSLPHQPALEPARRAAGPRRKSGRRPSGWLPGQCRTGLRPGSPRSLHRRQSRRATDRRS